MAVAFFELAANAAVDATAEDGAPTINVRKHINDEFIDGLRSTTGATREAEVRQGGPFCFSSRRGGSSSSSYQTDSDVGAAVMDCYNGHRS